MSAKLRQILEGCPEIPTETKDGEEEEEDDYMSMAIVEPSKTGGETLTQKRLRKQREVSSTHSTNLMTFYVPGNQW